MSITYLKNYQNDDITENDHWYMGPIDYIRHNEKLVVYGEYDDQTCIDVFGYELEKNTTNNNITHKIDTISSKKSQQEIKDILLQKRKQNLLLCNKPCKIKFH